VTRLATAFLLIASLLPAQQFTGFDEFAAQAMKDWRVPGAAIAVVKDGKVILSKGYGLRDVSKSLPVTPKTVFAIGSVTKSFTVASLGSLADEGKLDWDKPVREYLPGFRLYDRFATEQMTPRDLVTHRSGLPRHDSVWYNSPLTREQMVERLRHLEPSREFRTTYQYQNLMFVTAGYLAGKVAGSSWEDLVRQRLFAPLGMKSSNFAVADSQKAPDYALPYRRVKDQVELTDFRVIDEIGPAGSINSNIEDMIRYVAMYLNQGRHEGAQILSSATVQQMTTPQIVIPGALRWKENGHQSYGMGLMVGSYQGRKLVQHGGNIDGFSALIAMLPQENAGLVVLTNMNGSSLPAVLAYRVWDLLLGVEPVDWTARMKADEKLQRASEAAAKEKGYTPKRAGTQPSHALSEYAGEYEHPAYGLVRIGQQNGALTFTFNGFTAPLAHFHYDIFEIGENSRVLARSKVQFQTSLQGDVAGLTLPFESSVKEIAFARRADASMRERTFLQPFTGSYALGPQTVTVSLKSDSALALAMPGQPPYELKPVSGTRFEVPGLTGYNVEFRKDSGELIFYQPNGTYVAKRVN
jgi:CubicO group peptidase (beta-lactamase class C family)